MLRIIGFFLLATVNLAAHTLNFDKSQWTVDHDLFVVHAIPKCGTHLIQPITHLMTEKKITNWNLKAESLVEICANNQVIRFFQPYKPELAKTLKDGHHKIIALVRDPRDALISCLFYMRSFSKRKREDNTKRDFFTVGMDFDQCTFDQQLTSLIQGDEHAASYIKYYKDRIGWALKASSYVAKYEELVGTAGGGDDDLRRKTVLAMARYVHIDLAPEVIDEQLRGTYIDFGQEEVDGKIFKHSCIGNWKTFLSKKQKVMIKKLIGEEIIKLGYEADNNW